jgi:hypothetical protein
LEEGEGAPRFEKSCKKRALLYKENGKTFSRIGERQDVEKIQKNHLHENNLILETGSQRLFKISLDIK